MYTVTPSPVPPSPLPGHVIVAAVTTDNCGALGVLDTYADGTYNASDLDWNRSLPGTWNRMSNNGTAYMNQSYARYYQPTYVPQPSGLNTATQYLSRVFFVSNSWAYSGGTG